MDTEIEKKALLRVVNPIRELRSFLKGHSQTSILRHVLGHPIPNAPNFINNMVVVVVDCESFERKHEWTTEIGMTVIDSREVQQYAGNPGLHGENYYKGFYYYHIRHKPYAHCINTKWAVGDPTSNRFGNTKFLTTSEIKQMLHKCFAWPIVDRKPEFGYCPIVFMGHASANDTTMLYQSFNFDLNALGTVVAELDTQVMARELGISHKSQIGLSDLCDRAGFQWRDRHTAGNDAAYTAIGATALVLENQFAQYEMDHPSVMYSKTMQDVVTETEAVSKVSSYLEYGLDEYCIKCGRDGHSKAVCYRITWCTKCQKDGRRARSHCDRTCSWVGR